MSAKLYYEWRKDWTLAIILTAIAFGGTVMLPFLTVVVPTQMIVLEEEGFRSEFIITVSPINRYIPNSYVPQGNIFSAGIPRSAQTINTTYDVYVEDFEGSTTWVCSGTGGVKKMPAYHGSYLYQMNPKKNQQYSLSKTANFTFKENETADALFYTVYNSASGMGNGWYVFSLNVTWNNGTNYVTRRITQVIDEKTTLYPTTNPKELVLPKISSPVVWSGYLISDIRELIAVNMADDSIYYTSFTITDMRFRVYDTSKATVINVDYVKLQKTPWGFHNVWYEGNNPRTDYFVQVNYTLYVDTDIILDLASVAIRFDIWEFINGSLLDRAKLIIDTQISHNFTFIASVLGQYDVRAKGTWTSILHALPYYDPLGTQMVYNFDANLTAWAFLPDNSTTRDQLYQAIPSEAFTVDYKSPIDLQ